ncbi:MAG: hypothetical protein C0501_27125 [Isosphaera sp.]|nr:hypothetical protein [Isosphaera sp.]
MDKPARLRQLVAPLAGVGEADLTRSARLAGRLKTSIGRATLDAVLRREFGTAGTAVYRAATYGDLEDAVLGGGGGSPAAAPAAAPSAPAPAAEAAPGPWCGIDIERVDDLPAAADYWDAEFYRTHFTPDEIAYCVRQEAPREHFAARWCAKEALRKCDARYLRVGFAEIEVVVGEDGAVRLAHLRDGRRAPLPHGVSLSHSAGMAAAVVLGGVAVAAPDPVPSVPAAPARPAGGRGGLTTLIALAALGLAVWGLLR